LTPFLLTCRLPVELPRDVVKFETVKLVLKLMEPLGNLGTKAA
jgi:hypothetical protein